MYKILNKQQLTSVIYLMDVHAPLIAEQGLPGQFVIVIPTATGERIPLTICDTDRDGGTVRIVFQVVGYSTECMSKMESGDELYAIVGPLGRASELATDSIWAAEQRVLFVCGGVGTAPVYPQAKWCHSHGIPCDVIIGARTRELLFFEDEMRAVCDNLYLMTDDGSYGERGLVTDKVQALHAGGNRYTLCVAIGPLPMMKFTSLLTQRLGIRTIVSLNSMMVDGTGMCGACRVTVDGQVRFTCVDGPEFDGHKVDYDEAMRRLANPAREKYPIATSGHEHSCNLAAAVAEGTRRQRPAEQEPQVRIHNFEEVCHGFTEEQAVAEARRCLHCKRPLCVGDCPVSIQIPDFIAAVADRRFADAADIIARDSALPAVCGRVCPQETQCEGACILGRKGDPIAIGYLERFVADWARTNNHKSAQAAASPAPSARKVAIIGSGPSGLTCAGDLAKAGFKVTIFEALHHAGGVLVYGIPEFRLPKERVVAPEIDNLRRLGVEIKTNVIVGRSITVDDLLTREGYSAVYIASGAGLPKFMGIPGETLVGVVSANELLTRANLMHGYDSNYATPIHLGRHVVVVGGGNVAMDAARTARRLGSEVTVVYRRAEADMPARVEEVHHAKEEGIHFEFQSNPVYIVDDGNGNVGAVRCIRMAMGEPGADGRRRFSVIEGSEFSIEADNVVIALGTSPNPLIKATTPGLDTESWGGIIANEEGATSRPMVFAGGDAVSGSATVILAMGAGRRAAKAIAEALAASNEK
ncbi:MAG: NADPH-dependent glutamate synthase [Bacteroidales bacterium]|nr:NADPH-dependent glutamate synthase [Bacteroidales bacterium]